jgi:hypothetical protein
MVTHNSPEVASAPVTGRGFVPAEPAGALPQNLVLIRSYVSWGAIIAGSLLGLSIIALSSSLGYACGVPAFYGGHYGWGAGIWAVVTAAIAFFCGGCVASYLSSANGYYHRMLHGVMMWGLTVPLMLFFFAGTFGSLVAHTGVVLTGGTPSALFPAVGAAWGVFISLAVGLIFAAIGGAAGIRSREL